MVENNKGVIIMLAKLDLLIVFLGILALALFLVLLYGVVKCWKTSKFISFIFLLLAVAEVVAGYAIFGDRIAKLFQ